MSEIVYLFANAKPDRWTRIERACEEIEACGGEFTTQDLQRPVGYSIAVLVIGELRRHGLIEPINVRTKPIVYRAGQKRERLG